MRDVAFVRSVSPHDSVSRASISAARLPRKARHVLVRRYDLDDSGSTSTLAELAAELGLSRERVRQLQNEAEQLLKFGTRRVPRRSVA